MAKGFVALRWSYGGSLITVNLLAWVLFFIRPLRGQGVFYAFVAIYGLSNLAIIITTIIAALLLLRLRKALQQQTTLAQVNWRNANAAPLPEP
jgi:hypothetical protein